MYHCWTSAISTFSAPHPFYFIFFKMMFWIKNLSFSWVWETRVIFNVPWEFHEQKNPDLLSWFCFTHFYGFHIFSIPFLYRFTLETGFAWIFWHSYLIRVNNNNKWIQEGKNTCISEIKFVFTLFYSLSNKNQVRWWFIRMFDVYLIMFIMLFFKSYFFCETLMVFSDYFFFSC